MHISYPCQRGNHDLFRGVLDATKQTYQVQLVEYSKVDTLHMMYIDRSLLKWPFKGH